MNSLPRTRAGIASRTRLFAISIFLGVLLTQAGKPQQIVDPPRLGLEFRCPAYVLAPNQAMSLQAHVFGSKELLAQERANLISFRWEISGGKVVVGQGTPSITIEACELPATSFGSINVKVILNGGPPDLEKEKLCTLRIDPKCARPVLFDQYQGTSQHDEQHRLDRLAKYLTSEGSGSVVFVVAYAGQTSCIREADWRANRASKYLLDRYKLDANRIIAVDGGFRDKLTIDLFVSQRDSCGPFPTPSLMGSSAHVTGSCADKYKETVSP